MLKEEARLGEKNYSLQSGVDLKGKAVIVMNVDAMA